MPFWRKHLALNPNRDRRPSRTKPRFVPEFTLLEDRCVLSSSILGNEILVNTSVISDQAFTNNNDRSMDVLSDGTTIVAWAGANQTIMARRIGLDGYAIGGEFLVATGTSLIGNANVAIYRKANAGEQDRVVISWTSHAESGGNNADVYGRIFHVDGTPVGAAFRVNATTNGDQRDASVDWIAADKFVVAWSGAGQGETQTVFARIFDATGTPVSAEIRVPETKTGPKQEPVVIGLPNGGFQIAWSGNGPGDANGIFMQQFTSTGAKVRPTEVRVNSSTPSKEQQPTMARSANQVVIAWQSNQNPLDRSGTSVVARRFGLDGQPLGGEFLVNEAKPGNQTNPTIAFLSNGGFTVAYRSSTTNAAGIYQREFNPDGTARFGERRVNRTDASTQVNPTVRAQGPDGYVIVWDGTVLGDKKGVGMQRYGDPLMPAITSDNRLVPDAKHPDLMYPEVMYLDPSVPTKTITLLNTSNLTIYPILEDANSNALGENNHSGLPSYVGLYDPYDGLNQEYRGYIGYKDAATGQFFLGLRPGQSFTFKVPLVFWDAARLHITTDAQYMITPTGQPLPFPNPFLYYDVDPYKGNPQTAAGSVQMNNSQPTSTLILTGDQSAKLHVGQYVASDGDDIFEGTTVSSFVVENGNTKVTLSKVARNGGANHTYTFYKPTARYMEDTSLDGTLGRIMWYHARAKDSGDAEGIGLDAPTQLTEFTIRDPFMGSTDFKTAKDIADSEKIMLINYDVSYVDSMVLSVAMEATDVQVVPLRQYKGNVELNNGQPTDKLILKLPFDPKLLTAGMVVTSTTGDLGAGTLVVSAEAGPNQTTIVHLSKPGLANAGAESTYSFATPSPTNAYGWIGSQQTFDQMQAIIKKFTSNTAANGLGQYFDGNGYPQFYNPDVTLSGIKLPSGQNLPLLSPLKGLGSKSHFDNDQFIVTSNGVGRNELSAGGNNGPGANQIYLNFPDTMSTAQRQDFLKQLNAGKAQWQVTADGTPLPMIQTVGTLDGQGRAVVTLKGNTGLEDKGYTFTFKRPVTDYASTRLAEIWYSWARYYVEQVQARFPSFQPVVRHGTISTIDEGGTQKPTNQLTIQGDVTSLLALGMVVETDGNNFPVPTSDDPITRVTILDMKYDSTAQTTTIFLSKRPTGVGTANTNYTFKLPVMLTPADPGVTTFKLAFNKNQAEMDLFAQTTYQVMEAMSTIPKLQNQGFDWLQVLANCIGGNIGFIKNIGVANDGKSGTKYTGYAGISTDIRDKVKSVLRGVWNFNVIPETTGKWYPDPALKGDGSKGTGQLINGKPADYNVVNLDPFVWFVHKQLGLSGYGFSLDDDVADVGANGATKLAMNTGGLTGLPQQAEWTWGAPYGPVTSNHGTIGTYDAPGSEYNGYSTITGLDALPLPIAMLVNGFDKNVGPGAFVVGPGIPPGTRVVLTIQAENAVVLDTKNATVGATGVYNFSGTPPKVVQEADASQVKGKSVMLSVLGADPFFNEATLIYTWSVLTGPQGTTFSVNGTNASKNTKATVAVPGTYVFRATIADPKGFFVTSDVTVTF